MTGPLVALCCVLVTALGVPLAIASGSVHAHPIRFVGLLLVPVVPVIVLLLAVVADLGWWLVLLAGLPSLVMLVGLILKDPDTGRNLLTDVAPISFKRIPVDRRHRASKPTSIQAPPAEQGDSRSK